MKTYFVTWEIEVDAESHKDAARQALEIQRDPQSTAVVFDVVKFDGTCHFAARVRVDLQEKK